MRLLYSIVLLLSLLLLPLSVFGLLLRRWRRRALIALLSSVVTLIGSAELLGAATKPLDLPVQQVAQLPSGAASDPDMTPDTAPPSASKEGRPSDAQVRKPMVQNYPDPILDADDNGPIVCDTKEQLSAYNKSAHHNGQSGEPVDRAAVGCDHMSGKFVVKVLEIDDGFVEITIPGSPRGDKVAFVNFDSLQSPSAAKRGPKKYQITSDAAVVCSRTTDFDEAMEAARQLDVQWFRSNSKCVIGHKGDAVYMYKYDIPFSKVCLGRETSCFLGWVPVTAIDEIKVPNVIAKGQLRICWPTDTPADERNADLVIPVGLIFLDDGEIGNEAEIDQGRDATIVTTKQVVLRKSKSCVVAPANLLDDPDAKWDHPAVRTAKIADKRYYVPNAIQALKEPTGQIPLPDTFMLQPLAYVDVDFK